MLGERAPHHLEHRPGTLSEADRFGAAVVVQNKFIPHQIDPNSGDVRILGAEVNYQFLKNAPKNVTPNTCR